ncbi:hypothetical protein LTR85_006253 [Meristemomyces frigidus]|nr:hypothetical protein LTR85_006253 [Meristemomyces frigidus]
MTCVYSPQKQMGRPKKRQRTDDEQADAGSGLEARRSRGPARQQAWTGARVDGQEDIGASAALVRDALAYFAPAGSDLQPWLPPADWPMPIPIPHEHALPSLTPDSSSNSPPTINLPPELRSASHSHSHPSNNTHTHTPAHPPNPSTQSHLLHLDPSLASGTNLGCPPSANPTCACLSTLYLTLSTLQSLSTFAFPFALHPLREAMSTASEVLACRHCPTKFLNAVQNTHLLGTLLMSIAERFSKVVESIDSEAIRAECSGETKKFRLADLNDASTSSASSHLHHTGGLGCAGAFSIDLSPVEWRGMAKKVVRAEVHGPSDGNGRTYCPYPYFTDLTKRMQERQETWHSGAHALPPDFPRDGEGQLIGGPRMPKEDHICLKLIGYSNKLVEGLDWT